MSSIKFPFDLYVSRTDLGDCYICEDVPDILTDREGSTLVGVYVLKEIKTLKIATQSLEFTK